ncbi:nitroreductase [Balneicella halophila]|uniref:Nitroreductase n=1 Tax=Balneicella halophila TaxID=1537566 RepID=A0A7L4UQX9_BALHA|nr:nitroreductase family protein [Balneicella halophila]PVX51012.1 nitroreductase [Balneicella halophila]
MNLKGIAMDFKDLIHKRHSVRNYSPKKVSRDLIEKIVEAGRLAPSACNKQPWRFMVIDEPELLEKVGTAYKRAWFHKAPAVIIAYGNREEAWVRDYDGKNHCDVDVAIAVDHMTLMAAELGLGTCWVCHFVPEALLEVVPVASNWEPIAMISLGYSDKDKTSEKKRKATEEIVRYNSWE